MFETSRLGKTVRFSVFFAVVLRSCKLIQSMSGSLNTLTAQLNPTQLNYQLSRALWIGLKSESPICISCRLEIQKFCSLLTCYSTGHFDLDDDDVTNSTDVFSRVSIPLSLPGHVLFSTPVGASVFSENCAYVWVLHAGNRRSQQAELLISLYQYSGPHNCSKTKIKQLYKSCRILAAY